jgi:serine/threonine protein kinase
VFNEAGNVVGFTMPLIDTSKAIPLHQLYNPKVRRQRAPGMTWQYLVRIGRNLTAVVAALHEKGYVIGDLNESNVLVTDRALVTLVDCDSVQVRDGRKTYRCTVGKGEYTPPELQGIAFQQVNRGNPHDNFALAVLLFLLLMEGVHPFSGVYQLEGDPPGLLDNIQHGRSPYLKNKELKPMAIAPAIASLPLSLCRHFNRALGSRPRGRPSAKAWLEVLTELEQDLAPCQANPLHVFSAHLKNCPWCERRDTLGLEPFPVTDEMRARLPQIVSPKPLPRLRGSLWDFVKFFPIITVVLTVLGSFGGLGLLELLQLERFLTNRYRELASSAGLFIILSFVLVVMMYQRVKKSAVWYRGSRLLEGVLQASLGGLAFALLITTMMGWVFGVGSIFKGDWSLLPALWLIAFGLLWRYLRRYRY